VEQKTKSDEAAALHRFSPSSCAAYASFIRRQCPTSRRVQSSFAAAGAHSALGEMLQFFAIALTRLFSEGVDSTAVLSFPTEWEQRLNAPAAASLRKKYLYELQGFSALFAHVWANVAAEHPSRRPAADGTEKEEEEEEPPAKALQKTRVATAAPPTSSLALPPGERREREARHQAPAGDVAVAAAAAPPFFPQLVAPATSRSAAISRKDPPAMTSAANAGINAKSRSLSSTTFRPHPIDTSWSHQRQSLPLSNPTSTARDAVVLSHGLVVQAKGMGPALPTIPLEGLVLSGQLPGVTKSVDENAVRGRKALPRSSPSSTRDTQPPAKGVEGPHLSPSARQQAILQAMEQDRERELKHTLGVRSVRNFAKDDMQEYLLTFQQNMHSLLEEDLDEQDDDGGDTGVL
jgi:hypothetical protein